MFAPNVSRAVSPIWYFPVSILYRPRGITVTIAVVLPRQSVLAATVCGVACFVLVAGLLLGQTAIAAVAKLVASSAFIAAALAAGATDSRFGRIVLAGLVLSWFGDAFLIGTARQWFLLGLVSFLCAHVAYVTAFVTLGVDRRWSLTSAAIIIVIAALVLAWLTPYLPEGFVWPVRVYTAVISLMVITAFGTLGAGASPLIVAGAVLFYFSDLSVAAMRFTDPLFATYVLGLPLYYAGQLCLALSVATVRTVPR
jgi:uncharacterized membrane protein YhhN